jgi:TolB protein
MMVWRVSGGRVLASWRRRAEAQQGPLRIEITEGVIEPLPFAIPEFQAETPNGGAVRPRHHAGGGGDLVGTGLFREIPPGSFVSR